jgi:hypothetical protein
MNVPMLKCNVNVPVYVKLTGYGLEKLDDYFKDYAFKPEPDHAGYYKFPLWELMRIFGPHHFVGDNPCFENNEIVFVR